MKINKRKMISLLSVLLVLVMVFAVGCGGSKAPAPSNNGDAADDTVYKFTGGIQPPATHPTAVSMQKFADLVKEKTNGKVLLTVLPDAQLGGERELLEGVQLGTVDFSNITTTIVANAVPQYLVFDLPFLFANDKEVYSYFDSKDGRDLLKHFDAKNMKGIGYLNNGFRVTSSNIPIKKADDVKGLSIRTQENQLHMATWKALGAQPTPLAMQDLYTALQQGVVGAQENPFSVIASFGLYEIQDYISETNHINSMTVTMFNKAKWDSIPAKYQEAIMEAWAEVEKYDRGAKEEALKADIAKMEAAGTTVIRSTDIDLNSFKEKVQSVYTQYEGQVGKDLLNSILKK
ncbi:MAG: TRAP transporter substrate-binding protein [Clostridiaceae bacterium]|nr:TRAP transporter substrate-binding protein [Clostridiaceae bacterium]